MQTCPPPLAFINCLLITAPIAISHGFIFPFQELVNQFLLAYVRRETIRIRRLSLRESDNGLFSKTHLSFFPLEIAFNFDTLIPSPFYLWFSSFSVVENFNN